jgi:excisionase family DNA binding protein
MLHRYSKNTLSAPEEGMTRSVQCQTISVPEAGRRLGIGRNHAYECARRGELPVIRLGHKLVVPLAAFERMLSQAKPITADLTLQREKTVGSGKA